MDRDMPQDDEVQDDEVLHHLLDESLGLKNP